MTNHYETINKGALQFKIYSPTVPRSTVQAARNSVCVSLLPSENENVFPPQWESEISVI